MTEYRNEIRRHLSQYWLRNMEKQFIAFVAIFLIFSFYEVFITEANTLAEGIEQTPFVLIGGGMIVLGVYAATAGQSSIPLAVSFGSTRKEAFLGSQFSELLMMLQFILIFVVFKSVMGGKEMLNSILASSCFFFAGCMLLVLGIGQMFAVIVTKLGAKGGSIFIVAIIMITVFGLTLLLMLDNFSITDLFGYSWATALYAMCIGCVVYIAGVAINYGNVKKMAVKR